MKDFLTKITSYNEFDDIDSKWKIMNKKYSLTNHFNELEIYIIELKKLRNSATLKESKKNFWLWFIDHTNKEMVNLSSVSNERIKEAREQLAKIQADPELMERIRLEEAYEMDVNTSIANARSEGEKAGELKGIKQGEQKNKIETAKKMLELGLDIYVIEKSTGLTREEIEKLK